MINPNNDIVALGFELNSKNDKKPLANFKGKTIQT